MTRPREAVLVLRLWTEPHDRVVRGRLLTAGSPEATLAMTVDGILAAVEDELRSLDGDGNRARDATATGREHSE